MIGTLSRAARGPDDLEGEGDRASRFDQAIEKQLNGRELSVAQIPVFKFTTL